MQLEDPVVVVYTSGGSMVDRPLGDLEPLVREISHFDGSGASDSGWNQFVASATESTEFGHHLINCIRSCSNAVISVDWKDPGTAYSRAQSVCRWLGIPRMPAQYRPVSPNQILVELHEWLQPHGMACLELDTRSDSYCGIVATRPAEVMRLAQELDLALAAPIGLSLSADTSIPHAHLPPAESVAIAELELLGERIDRVEGALAQGATPTRQGARTPAMRLAQLLVWKCQLTYAAGLAIDQLRDCVVSTINHAETLEQPLRFARSQTLAALARLLDMEQDLGRLAMTLPADDQSVTGYLATGRQGWSELDPAYATNRLRLSIDRIVSNPDGDEMVAAYEQWSDSLPGSNLGTSPEDAYLGWWAFELAAVAKMTGADDSGLATAPLYPHRLRA